MRDRYQCSSPGPRTTPYRPSSIAPVYNGEAQRLLKMQVKQVTQQSLHVILVDLFILINAESESTNLYYDNETVRIPTYSHVHVDEVVTLFLKFALHSLEVNNSIGLQGSLPLDGDVASA